MLVLGLVDLPWWAILLLLLVAFYLYETRNFNFFKDQGIPFIKPFPLIGTMYMYTNMREGDMEVLRRYKDEGKVGGFIRDRPILVVWDEQFLSDVLVKEATNFINHMQFSDPGGLGSKMLFNMDGERWKITRNEMSPTFSTGKLKAMNREIDRCAKALGEYLLEQAVLGQPIEVKEYVGGFTMDVIASTAFGIQLNSVKDKDDVFVANAQNLMDANLNAPKAMFQKRWQLAQGGTGGRMCVCPWLTSILQKLGFSFEPFSKEALAFFANITKQAIEIRKSDDDQSRTDFLQIMVNGQKGRGGDDREDKTSTPRKGLTTDEIVANAVNFFQAGYDTVANGLSFLMYSLATNPDIQTRLIEEIDSVVKDVNNVPYSVLQELPYLEKCISETMRLYPIALTTSRIAQRDMTIRGVFVKKGMAIMLPIFAMQRHPDRWPDPDRFDPERFSSENKAKRNFYHYIPFGAGPRMCIGNRLALQEMKMGIIHILKRVTVETCDKTAIPIQFENAFLLKPADLWLKTVKR